MKIIAIIKSWLSRKQKLSDRDRVRNMLVKEATYATALAGFLCHAFNHGHGVRITVQADGEECGVAILAHAKEPLVEYLAQWSCAQKLVKVDRLDEFDKGGEGAAPVSGVCG
jgi:hypothetical protein